LAYADFRYLQVFVSFFLFDFLIRVFINPKFAQTLIVARGLVQGQTPE
jgi:hypothetical protein